MASRSPFFTASPARIFSVTVDAAGAYSVGLTAATTRPFTDASRTKVPRLTSAMRRRAASTERELPSQPESSMTTATSATAPPAASRSGRRLVPVMGEARTVSVAEVSLIME
jgi:hypothetical protein